MLEVFTHNILYVRRAYPLGIFKKCRIYNCAVFRSRYPPLNEYISNAIRSAMFLHKFGHLNKFEIVLFICNEPDSKLESYVFAFEPTSNGDLASKAGEKKTKLEQMRMLNDFGEKMRSMLLALDAKCKNLMALPDRFQFKIDLHTNQLGHSKLLEEEKLQVRIAFVYTKFRVSVS